MIFQHTPTPTTDSPIATRDAARRQQRGESEKAHARRCRRCAGNRRRHSTAAACALSRPPDAEIRTRVIHFTPGRASVTRCSAKAGMRFGAAITPMKCYRATACQHASNHSEAFVTFSRPSCREEDLAEKRSTVASQYAPPRGNYAWRSRRSRHAILPRVSPQPPVSRTARQHAADARESR